MRHLRSLLGLMLCAVSVAGCTSDAAPVPAPRPSLSTPLTSGSPTGPSASPTPTPRETPTETPPPMPAAAKGDGRAAAKAFVRYYIDLINYAGRTGDVRRLKARSGTDCLSCMELVRLFSMTYSQGGYFHTRGWTPGVLFVSPGRTSTDWVGALEVIEHRVEWQTSSTAPETSSPNSKLNLRLEFRVDDGQWSVSKMTRS